MSPFFSSLRQQPFVAQPPPLLSQPLGRLALPLLGWQPLTSQLLPFSIFRTALFVLILSLSFPPLLSQQLPFLPQSVSVPAAELTLEPIFHVQYFSTFPTLLRFVILLLVPTFAVQFLLGVS